jgi:hypothetical protein
MNPDWFSAVLEEYRSLRAEAVTARDAQLSILRLALPVLAALIGVGVSLKNDDRLLAGVLLSIALPVIFVLTFELWLGQVQRSIRAGNVVAAIEQRLADLFRGEQYNGASLSPPMGWEQWLRRRDGPTWRPNLSQQQWESTLGAALIFIFLFIAAVVSYGLGVSFLAERSDKTAMHVAIVTAFLTFGYLIGRARVAIRALGRKETVPSAEEIWPAAGTWRESA